MLGQGIVDRGQKAGMCLAGVLFSAWEKGGGEFEGEYREEFGLGVGGEEDVWDAGEV